MSFKTVSSILRGKWLLDKEWAAAHLPVVMNVLAGNGSFKEVMGEKDDHNNGKADKAAPQLVLSHKAGAVYKVSAYTELATLPEGSIAMLTLAGPVTKYGDICAHGMIDHAATIKRIADSANIKGLILNIDSPGGEASGTAMLAGVVADAGKKKPVIAFVDDGIAASAAMWIASAANEIYVTQKTDRVGSVGVYTTIADWATHYQEYYKLTVKEVYAPQSTDKNKEYYDALNGNEQPLKEELAVLAQEFIDTVAANRAGKIKGTEWQTGKMFYAKDALRIGLIDGIKSLDQVVRRMDSLIKNQPPKSNTMAFEKTLKAAASESFEVVDGGFLLSETELNNIEASLDAHELAVARVAELEAQLQTAEQAREQAANELATANQTISTQSARILELEQEDAGGSATGKQSDAFGGKKDYMDYGFQKELLDKI